MQEFRFGLCLKRKRMKPGPRRLLYFGGCFGQADALRCARRNNNQPNNRNNDNGFRLVSRESRSNQTSYPARVTHDAGHLRMPGRQMTMTWASFLCPISIRLRWWRESTNRKAAGLFSTLFGTRDPQWPQIGYHAPVNPASKQCPARGQDYNKIPSYLCAAPQ